jgi:hypothetical protein
VRNEYRVRYEFLAVLGFSAQLQARRACLIAQPDENAAAGFHQEL